MPHGRAATFAMLARMVGTSDGCDASPVNRNPGAETAEMLSAYTTSRQRDPSQERHVHIVLPGVCPGVEWAVIATSPTCSTSPSPTPRTFATRGNPLLANATCGSSGVGLPAASARAPAAPAATRAPVHHCRAEIPPA